MLVAGELRKFLQRWRPFPLESSRLVLVGKEADLVVVAFRLCFVLEVDVVAVVLLDRVVVDSFCFSKASCSREERSGRVVSSLS